jgi:hypothetical protein
MWERRNCSCQPTGPRKMHRRFCHEFRRIWGSWSVTAGAESSISGIRGLLAEKFDFLLKNRILTKKAGGCPEITERVDFRESGLTDDISISIFKVFK